MKKIITLSFLSLTANFCFAGGFTDCSINEIRFGSGDQNAHVVLNCTINSPPACANSDFEKTIVAFDRSTETGKARLSLLLVAFSAGYKVSGGVQASCPSWQPNISLLDWVIIKK